ncbi:MAG: sigma-54 dependent transcriptional regulator [bacterium]
MLRILIIDDESKICKLLELSLSKEGYEVDTSTKAREGLEKARRYGYDVIICDLKMPEVSGITILSEVKKHTPDTEVIIITAYATVETAVSAMKEGAYDYLIKPFQQDELKLLIKRIGEKKRLIKENIELKQELKKRYRFDQIVGRSGKMRDLLRLVEKVAPTDTMVLIRGETGTGKELIAQAIHHNSKRSEKPLVVVHCATLPSTLLESELFGYERGAFTGAEKEKPGRFELADKGTIFLDEIGEMALEIQAKLLRVLQYKEFVRLGGVKTTKVDVRIIAATNKDLEEALKKGEFREDLYYRISTFPIFLPPLRERKEDISDLIYHFLHHQEDRISKEAISSLAEYDWPGNVRELENVIEQAQVLAQDSMITPDHLSIYIRERRKGPLSLEIPDSGLSLAKIEEDLVKEALKKAGGNKTKAAKLLGITRRSLYSKLKKMCI